MSLSVKHLYEFGEFRLDIGEKILMRGESPVEITPKGFELLCVLVENHGRLLGKNELMDTLWADSFVEESNLTFNIRQLRKILGDDAHDPTYIKTIRRHGYRFIAEVRPVVAESVFAAAGEEDPPPPESFPDEEASAPPSNGSFPVPKNKKKFAPALLAVIFLLGGTVAVGLWYARNGNVVSDAPVLSAPFASEKLSTNGKVLFAVLSPDGKSAIYTNGAVNEKQSVWLRRLDDGGSVEIIPPSDDIYFGLAISPDGRMLYFSRRPRLTDEPRSIYRVPVSGGIPQKIIDETEGWLSVSPDGLKISFVRCYFRDDDYCSLLIADSADGKNEKRIVTRPRPIRIGDNRIAPDGKSIVFAVGQSATASNEFGLAEVDIGSGAERRFTNEKFFDVKNLVWLPDRSGLLLTASRIPNKNFRIWQVTAATQEARPLTKDSDNYAVLGLDKDANRIISTQFRQDFRLRLLNLEDLSVSRNLTDASSVCFAPDGKIYFSSIMSGNDEIWSINPDGSGQRQLTNDPADEVVPLVAPDNSTVFFVSNRTGAAQVWRMSVDGSNQTQLTEKEGGAPVFVSPDGKWVYYRHNLTSELWRVSSAAGGEELVLNVPRSRFAISPDGSQVAVTEGRKDQKVLTIKSLADGRITKTFRLADPQMALLGIIWTPDGKNLAYATPIDKYENYVLWFQSLDGGAPRQIAALGDNEISDFGLSVSPDGKTVAIVQGRWLHDAVLLNGLR
jgi:Tol biopolymer transport system component/DNA-binding winged helix-turn-helix (wHTH) protein